MICEVAVPRQKKYFLLAVQREGVKLIVCLKFLYLICIYGVEPVAPAGGRCYYSTTG